MATIIVGVFDNFTAARNAASDLVSKGVPLGLISVATPDAKGEYAAQFRKGEDDSEPTDILGGAALGSLAGIAAMGLAAVVFPGVGALLAMGPLAPLIAGATVGAATGSLIVALNGMGLPEFEAQHYEETVQAGHSLVIVTKAETQTELIVDEMRRHDALKVDQLDLQEQSSNQMTSASAPPP